MIFFGCAYYPWRGLDAVPVAKYAVLVNPLVYVAEGMRAALTPQVAHMPLAAVVGRTAPDPGSLLNVWAPQLHAAGTGVTDMAIASTAAVESINGSATAAPAAGEAESPRPGPARSLGAGALPQPWTIDDARSLYNMEGWGAGFFDVNRRGHVVVRPDAEHPERELDLFELAHDLEEQGVALPVLLRFSDILRSRLASVSMRFSEAINEFGYTGGYTTVYPIKVNQQRHVVEEIVRFGASHGVGLECGSKPELQAVLAMSESTDHMIVCNGYKDEEFMRLALMGQRLGHRSSSCSSSSARSTCCCGRPTIWASPRRPVCASSCARPGSAGGRRAAVSDRSSVSRQRSW